MLLEFILFYFYERERESRGPIQKKLKHEWLIHDTDGLCCGL